MDTRSSNPALQENTFRDLRLQGRTEVMTISGTVVKTGILLFLALLSAGYTWLKFFKAGANPATVTPWMWLGIIGGLVAAFTTVFKKEWAPITAPIYAVLEGLFIGGISAVLESAYPGVVIQAVGLTFGTLFAMLFTYQTGLIQATDKFKMGVFAATGGIAIFYLVMFVLSFFGIGTSLMYGNSWLSIGISLFVVVIAALNFIIDFDFIDQGSKLNVPKYMEWYGAFALMVTLVWLYIEFLRLLSNLRSKQ
jgi:uncharacterized YccA/Bax inhibitor family protein